MSALCRRQYRSRAGRAAALGVLAAMLPVLLSACADFQDSAAPQTWHPQQTLPPEQGPNPQIPGMPQGVPGAPGSSSSPRTMPPPKGCQDFNPAVIATCLNPVSAVAALPSNGQRPSGLAAERTTGRILRVAKGSDPVQVAKLQVNTAGGGGLTGIALSPSYQEDQLIFAYITTPTDNRVVRFASGEPPTPVLTGIPRGASDNRGVMALDHDGALLVATGDAGNPAAAGDPHSLAGKVLRIDDSGKPAPGDPTPGSAVIASGLSAPGGICSSSDGKQTWVTDRTPEKDVLYRVYAGKSLGTPAWTWQDRPGVAGCAVFPHAVMVATAIAGNVQSLPLNADGTFSGKPQIGLDGKQGYGRLSGLDLASDRYAIAGTVNKDGGKPISSDDRVVVILPQSAGGGGKD